MATAYRLMTCGPIKLPDNGIGFQTYALDTSAKRLAWVVQAPEDITITHCGFRYHQRTGTPPTYKIRIFPLTGDGHPDTTTDESPEPSATFTPPADATWNATWQYVALDNSKAVTRGQFFAIDIAHSAGTVDGSNNSSFTHGVEGWGVGRIGFPYADINTGGGYSKQGYTPVHGYKSASSVYGFPALSDSDTSISTNGQRAALKFTLPSGLATSFKLVGLRIDMATAAGGTFKIGLWSASSELQSLTIDGDYIQTPDSVYRDCIYYFDESSLTELTPGTTYYLGIEATGSTLHMYGITVNSSNELKAFAGGDTWMKSTYNGSVWSDTNTVRPGVELIFEDITGGSAGTIYTGNVAKITRGLVF